MQSSKQIRWGILSTANIARKAFVPGVAASKNGTVVAIASRSVEKAQEAATQLGIPAAYGSYEALLADPGVDAVYIGLPNNLHAEWTMKAADAGKPVLCVKPLARDAAEAQRMADYCAAKGVPLMEAFMYRFHPQQARVRELIDDGTIGDLRAVRLAFTFLLEPFNPANVRLQGDLAGGALMDVGCYCVNAARMLFGEEPQWASAQWDFRPEFGVEVALVGTLGFSDGRMAIFDCGFRATGNGWYMAAGTHGTIECTTAFVPRDPSGCSLLIASRGERREERIDAVDQYRLEAEAFGRALLAHEPVPIAPSDAVANLRAIEALHRSAKAGGTREPV
jgi:predicted dehydrogenase